MFPLAQKVGRSLTAVLLSTVVAWGAPVATIAARPVRAVAAEYITLDRPEGPPGTRVGVHGYGFGNCQTYPHDPTAEPPTPGEIQVTWDGGGIPSVTTAGAEGEFDTDVTAPSDATPGTYAVTALCTVDSKLEATAQFTVTADTGPTALTLDPAEGPVQTSVTVTGSGFEGCVADSVDEGGRSGTVALAWDGSPLPVAPPAEITVEGGSFTAEVAVPSDADPEDHKVEATCVGYEQVSAEAPFNVTDEPESQPEITLDPTSAPTGGDPVFVSVAGSGFDCSRVELLWDGEQRDTADAADDGTFTAQLEVPSDTSEAEYAVRGQCAEDPDVGAETVFTVTGPGPVPSSSPSPTPPDTTSPPPDPTTPVPTPDADADTDTDTDTNANAGTVPVGLIVGSGLLGAALLAAAGYVFLTPRSRGPRWVHDHISSRLRPAPAATDVAEYSDTGPPTHSVRLEPHPDPGDQTLKEEDP
ncbi:hypothetical protein [Streptomyces sp. NPDC048269]|uniref:hypothetical protein n=1 Tax=Streptomyces sp. NPDC048269 TaxID=3155753 RepID=UPI003449F12F